MYHFFYRWFWLTLILTTCSLIVYITTTSTLLMFTNTNPAARLLSKDVSIRRRLTLGDVSSVPEKGLSNNNNSNNISRVILLGYVRSGSTFIGHILNENPTMFYMFEPLRVSSCLAKLGVNLSDDENTNAKLLWKMMRCDFTDEIAMCFMDFDIGVHYSKNLSAILKGASDRANTDIPLSPARMLRDICLSYNGRVGVKLIRAKLEDIKELLEEDPNIKILQLVRDPRGVANSIRMSAIPLENLTHFKRYLKGEMDARPVIRSFSSLQMIEAINSSVYWPTINKICLRWRDDLRLATARPEWLRDRYKLVRYEDFATDPIRMTNEIYSFIGEQVPIAVMEWLEDNTNVTLQQSLESLDEGNMEVRKNSKATAFMWRKYLSRKECYQVQIICADVMKILGYHMFLRERSLLDEHIPAIGPIHLDVDLICP